ncbi:unnamed protein product, partial [Acanthocheilonema viteae]
MMSMEDEAVSSSLPVEIRIFKPFDEVKRLLLRKKKYQKMRYIQLKRWKAEFEERNVLVEHCVRTDYKLREAKAQLNSLNELMHAFDNDMDRLKEAIVQQREKDQSEFVKRVADLLYHKEIVAWLQKPEIREALYGEINETRILDEQEVELLNLVQEIINPRITWHTYEEIWKHMLQDFAKLGTKVINSENEMTTVHSNVCKDDIQLQSVEEIREANVQLKTEIPDMKEVAETDVRFELEMSNVKEIAEGKSSLIHAIDSLTMNNSCYSYVPTICVGMLIVI